MYFSQVGRWISAPILAVAISTSAVTGQQITDSAAQQIRDILATKHTLKAYQRKIDSNLLFAAMKERRQALPSVSADVLGSVSRDAGGQVIVDMKVRAVGPALRRLKALGGHEVYSSEHNGSIRARVSLQNVEALAQSPDVQLIHAASIARTNRVAGLASPFVSPTVPASIIRAQERARLQARMGTAPPLLAANGVYPSLHSLLRPLHIAPFIGSLTSQGYISHGANQAVALGVDGTGVKIGVLSDSASAGEVSALIATGDLPPDTVVLPGQDGGQGLDEGTAMMEIVHDLAPGAKLFFATAFTSESSFADNIRTLRFTYGCDIIVDDISYFDEPVFQDGVIASAVNDVTADGALYFSSAANSGNLTSGTSGTWEGDFSDGGDAGTLLDSVEGSPVRVHNFLPGVTLLYDTLTSPTIFIGLHWSDASGHSANDYDLFLLDSTGASVIAASANPQTGTQDPFESIYNPNGFPAGSRIVIVKYAGDGRALHIDTERGRLQYGTAGATFGHNAAANTVTLAATAWNSARQGTIPFTGMANRIESFSSDGPRRIFYNPDGSPITPDNFLFATGGGQTLQKPDFTAADGVTARTPGFNPFFGTSAAAPHAAAVAALVKSANPGLTSDSIRAILATTSLDTMAVGPDRDSGVGILMALPAVQSAIAH